METTYPATTIVVTLGRRLLNARLDAELTRGEVCRTMRVVPATLRNWETDRTVPRDRDLLALCDLLDLDAEELAPGIRNRCSTATRGAS